jgi:flagellar protein FliL
MSQEITAPNADETQVAPVKKKSRKLIMISLILILLGGGGGGFYYWRVRAASKALAAKEAAIKKDGDKGGKTETADGGDAAVTQVIELQPFIVNLADKNESRYLRMSISLGIADAEGEAKADPLFTTKIRNAILATISTLTSDQILTVEGKAELRKQMLTAARAAASKPEVLTIYITDFIVQM